MSCQSCGRRDCSPCNRHRHTDDNIVSREILRDDDRVGVTVNGDYTADPDDAIIHVVTPLGTTPAPIITLADPNDADEYAHVTIVSLAGPVTVTNLAGDGTGSRTVAGGTASTFYAIGSGDPCSDTGAIWVPSDVTTPTP